MNRELIQLSELVLGANHYLKTGDDFDGTTHDHIRSVTFEFAPQLQSGGDRQIVSGVSAWMKELGVRKTQKVYLFTQPSKEDVETVSSANGAQKWGFVTVDETKSAMWVRNWVLDEETEQWDVTYTEFPAPSGKVFSLDNNKYYMRVSFLKETLMEIGKLAAELGLDDWAEHFSNGYKILNGESVQPYINLPFKSLLKVEDCAAIIDALSWAWVFLGEGWWTDAPAAAAHEKDRTEEYETLTYALYQNCLYSLMYCINI